MTVLSPLKNPTRPPRSRRTRRRQGPVGGSCWWRRITRRFRVFTATVVVAFCLTVLAGDGPAFAADGTAQLSRVIDNARLWVVGLLVALATFFLAVGGVRYLASGGDPGEIEKAKSAFKSAAVGYAIAVLAPILMTALKSIVGG
jgi:succinate dehydrogenase/fumarate reductase cytochrome b subunit